MEINYSIVLLTIIRMAWLNMLQLSKIQGYSLYHLQNFSQLRNMFRSVRPTQIITIEGANHAKFFQLI